MTIGIAAICQHEGEQVVVFCSDWQGTRGFVKSDDVYKMEHFPNVPVLVSGDEGPSKELAVDVGMAMQKFNAEPKPTGDLDLRIGAYMAELRRVSADRKRIRTDHLLKRLYGISLDEFYTRGQNILTPAHYDRVFRDVTATGLGAELLLAYGDPDEPVLIRIDDEAEVHWEHGYSAIGSGATIALSILCQTDHSETMPLMSCAMWMFEAKLAAEKDPYVGPTTSMGLMLSEDRRFDLSEEAWAFILTRSRRIRPTSTAAWYKKGLPVMGRRRGDATEVETHEQTADAQPAVAPAHKGVVNLSAAGTKPSSAGPSS